MAIVGTHKPPFKGGSLDYMRWYARLRAQHLRSGSVLSWRAYYAEAKAKAVLKPPKVDTFGRAKLFGGALTPEYRRWYYRLQRWHSALPREQQDWPKFFAAARAEAEAQQLRTAPVNSSTSAQVQSKRATVVPFNPNRAQSLPFAPPPQTNGSDGRLMFDFSVDNAEDRDWR